MAPERILATLTISLSSPMDSCGRGLICQPSELRFLPPKLPLPTIVAVVCARMFIIVLEGPLGTSSLRLSKRRTAFWLLSEPQAPSYHIRTLTVRMVGNSEAVPRLPFRDSLTLILTEAYSRSYKPLLSDLSWVCTFARESR